MIAITTSSSISVNPRRRMAFLFPGITPGGSGGKVNR